MGCCGEGEGEGEGEGINNGKGCATRRGFWLLCSVSSWDLEEAPSKNVDILTNFVTK